MNRLWTIVTIDVALWAAIGWLLVGGFALAKLFAN